MQRHKSSMFCVAPAVFALAASGCASSPDIPEGQFARAQTSIEFAEQSGAREYGAAALERARNNLSIAQREAADGDYDEALFAAEKTELDAKLTAAQSDTRKAGNSLKEITDSISTLRREIERDRVSY